MRIAQIANVAVPVPPKTYGGSERVIYTLTEELVRRGHDVTLFASGDSVTSAKLISVTPSALINKIKTGNKTLANLIYEQSESIFGYSPEAALNIGLAYQMQDQFDIIHDHNYIISLAAANLAQTPVVMTLHSPILPSNKRLYETITNPYIVTISNSQAVPAPNLNYIGTVYNGLDMEDYPFAKSDDGYLLYVGTIDFRKGVHYAIDVAEYLNLPLIIAGNIQEEKKEYFDCLIKPRLNEKIRYIGEVDQRERNKLMSKALCFLHPTNFREPFGLGIIEAMACGCPVVAFNKGSMPEIIVDGKTGYLVEDVAEMIQKVSEIRKIRREDCRKHSLTNFNTKRMVDGYEEIYKKILEKKMGKNIIDDKQKTIIRPYPITDHPVVYAHELKKQ